MTKFKYYGFTLYNLIIIELLYILQIKKIVEADGVTRLDQYAAIEFGNENGINWWIIAAASGIGYPLQVIPGTIVRVPTNISEVFGVLVWVVQNMIK